MPVERCSVRAFPRRVLSLFHFIKVFHILTLVISALLHYDASYAKLTSQMQALILQADSQRANIVDLIYHWSFDVMEEITFSKFFQILTHPHSRHLIGTLRRFLSYLGPLSPTPWLLILGASLPWVADGWNQMFKKFKTCLIDRTKVCDCTTLINLLYTNLRKPDEPSKA